MAAGVRGSFHHQRCLCHHPRPAASRAAPITSTRAPGRRGRDSAAHRHAPAAAFIAGTDPPRGLHRCANAEDEEGANPVSSHRQGIEDSSVLMKIVTDQYSYISTRLGGSSWGRGSRGVGGYGAVRGW